MRFHVKNITHTFTVRSPTTWAGGEPTFRIAITGRFPVTVVGVFPMFPFRFLIAATVMFPPFVRRTILDTHGAIPSSHAYVSGPSSPSL